MNAATRMLRDRVLTAADTWERHLLVARLVGDARQVLDVGGLSGQLAAALPDASVTAANVAPPADLLVPRDGLPFKDRSIDTVTSLDVLEHVPPAARTGFVAELVRVAARRLVLCCPFGTPEHAAAEQAIQEWYRGLTGEGHPWLDEHIANGLPTQDELERAFAAAGGERVRFAYHGDFEVTNAQFRLIVEARHRLRPAPALAYLRTRVTHEPDLRLADAPQPRTNRVFVIVDR